MHLPNWLHYDQKLVVTRSLGRLSFPVWWRCRPFRLDAVAIAAALSLLPLSRRCHLACCNTALLWAMLMKNLMLNDDVDDNDGYGDGVLLEGGVYSPRQAIFLLLACGMATLAEALPFLNPTLLLLLLSSHCHHWRYRCHSVRLRRDVVIRSPRCIGGSISELPTG